jgi:hypothetical protein
VKKSSAWGGGGWGEVGESEGEGTWGGGGAVPTLTAKVTANLVFLSTYMQNINKIFYLNIAF